MVRAWVVQMITLYAALILSVFPFHVYIVHSNIARRIHRVSPHTYPCIAEHLIDVVLLVLLCLPASTLSEQHLSSAITSPRQHADAKRATLSL